MQTYLLKFKKKKKKKLQLAYSYNVQGGPKKWGQRSFLLVSLKVSGQIQ
jgi:hypothetical protein